MPIPKNELTGLRIRVERLLRGAKRSEDVGALFLALRDYSGGRDCVTEIGNFVAHRGERNVGISTREARDFFRTIQFHIDPYRKRPIDLLDLPNNISSLLESSFRRTPNDVIRQHLNRNRQTAEKNLSDLRSRLVVDTQGRAVLTFPTDLDQAILRCLLEHVTIRPAFTDEQLIEQLTACLVANSLLAKTEIKGFKSLRSLVGLFAVASMHEEAVAKEMRERSSSKWNATSSLAGAESPRLREDIALLKITRKLVDPADFEIPPKDQPHALGPFVHNK